MIDENGNGLAYRGDVDSWSVYDLWIENRVVLRVVIDNDDPELSIGFSRPDVDAPLLYRGGHARTALYSYKDGPGEADWRVVEHIDGDSVREFIYGQLVFVLADAYRPKEPAVARPDDM